MGSMIHGQRVELYCLPARVAVWEHLQHCVAAAYMLQTVLRSSKCGVSCSKDTTSDRDSRM